MGNVLTDWNFKNFHVQQDLQAGQFVNAETTLIASGPPEITTGNDGNAAGDATTMSVFPIGLLENFAISQSKQLQRIFEIGSSRSYFIPGRVIGSISLGRVFYFGPSLMRVLYSYYATAGSVVQIGQNDVGATIQVPSPLDSTFELTLPDPDSRLLDAGGSNFAPVAQSPGEDYFWSNLASDVFNQPFGMAVFFKDTSFVTVGAMYLEDTMLQGHQMSVSSGSVLIMEGVSAQYDRLVPIKTLVT